MEFMAKRLQEVLGQSQVLVGPEACGPFGFDGLCPAAVAQPKEAGQIVGVIKIAREMKGALIPRGNGTSLALGRPPTRDYIMLDLSNLNAIVEHDVPNLTLTCQAGASLSALYEAAEKAGQLLPLDPPLGPLRTAGGTLATSYSGPFTLGYGSLRDLVLSVRAVLSNGAQVRFGARVIKDVAGLNLGKLFIGSLGTLGVISEVTFRLVHRLEEERSLVAEFSDLAQAAAALARITGSALVPKALELVRPKASSLLSQGLARDLLLVAFAGLKEEVFRQIKETENICYGAGARNIDTLESEGHRLIWEQIRDFPFSLGNGEERLVLRASTVISEVVPTVRLLEKLAGEAGLESAAWAHAGTGTVYLISWGQNSKSMIQLISRARASLAGLAGGVIMEQAPLAVRKEVCPWGSPPASFFLMKRIKEAFDPAGLLNPGRFVGGI